ncbi:MAG: carbohydrate-binding domain-containing protein [Eubacterium sp.]|nr:carbohydrate-binding domain-containing protein [Eubacterium sp.]
MKNIVRTIAAFVLVMACIFCMKTAPVVNAEETKYDLWLGEVQVTSANKDNIPVKSGSASYNPATKTLKLNNVTGVNGLKVEPDDPNFKCLIYSEIDDLTITGSCDIKNQYASEGFVCTQNLNLNGNFLVWISGPYDEDYPNYGISSGKDLIILGGQLNCDCSNTDAMLHSKGDIYIKGGNLRLTAAFYGIYSEGDIYISGGYIFSYTQAAGFGEKGIAIYADGVISLDPKVYVSTPASGNVTEYTSHNYIYDTDPSKGVESATIEEKVGSYGISILGEQITNRNRFGIYIFEEGIVTYDPDTNTLFFDDVYGSSTNSISNPIVSSRNHDLIIAGNAHFDYPNCIDGINCNNNKLKVSGNFYISSKHNSIYASEVTFESGTCHLISNESVAIQSNSVVIKDGEHIFEGDEKAIETSSLTLDEGIKIQSPNGAIFDADEWTLVNSDGTYPKKVTIGPDKYDLKLSGVQVTSKNRNNLPGVTGEASFDPQTKTLNFGQGAKFENTSDHAMIESGDELTITGKIRLMDTNATYGIACKKLTVDGNVIVNAKECGVFTISGIDIKPDANLYGYAMQTNDAKGISTGGNIDVGKNGTLVGGGVTTGISVTGSIYTDSSNKIEGTGTDYGIKIGNDFKADCDVYAHGEGEAISFGGTMEFSPYVGIVKALNYDSEISATHFSDDKKHFLAADNSVAKIVEIGDKYGVYINGEKITYETRNDIAGLKSGKGSYDADTHTLYLDNAVINDEKDECIITLDDLNLVTKGDVNLVTKTRRYYGLNIKGKLTVDGNLYIETLDDHAIHAYDFELLNDSELLIPEGGRFDKEQKCIVDKDGNPATIVKIVKKEVATPTPAASSEPGSTPAPGTTPEPGTVSPGNTIEDVEAVILALPNDNDPAGSDFATLQAKASKVTKNSIKLSWKKVAGAKSYYIYGNKCGNKNKYKKIKVVSKTTFTQKKLKKGTYYKYLIVAVDKAGKVLSTSKTIHAATTGGKVGNVKSISTKAKKNKVTLKKGKKFKLKAKQKAASKKLKVKKHRAIQYESTNTAVATVSTKGVVKAVGKGKCYVYVYAQNGITIKIKVTVK